MLKLVQNAPNTLDQRSYFFVILLCECVYGLGVL